jgi:hypothetical protein
VTTFTIHIFSEKIKAEIFPPFIGVGSTKLHEEYTGIYEIMSWILKPVQDSSNGVVIDTCSFETLRLFFVIYCVL